MTIQNMFEFGSEPSLSVAERIEAASRGTPRGGSGIDLNVLHFASLGLALLLLGAMTWRVLKHMQDREWSVRRGWHGADEAVRCGRVERCSERVVATADEGLLIEFESIRPRHGEAIRLVDGGCAGSCRGFATLDPKGRGGSLFVLRRSDERSDAAASTEKETHEPVAIA